MTRVLAELLEARQPAFQFGIKHLERGNGAPKADIRLTNQIHLQVHDKLRQLNLDPHDTTGPELYSALKQRLTRDEQALFKKLRGTTTGLQDPVALVAHGLRALPLADNCFALKASVAKRLIKMASPKRTMKLLGYRSLDSMLKHESIGLLFAAAYMSESPTWSNKLLASYKKLKPSDFEVRPIAIEQPTAARWQAFSSTVVAQQRHHVFGFAELATVVMLPLPAKRPAFATLTTAALAIRAITELQAASTYLKLQQVQPDFGSIVGRLATEAPTISAHFFDRSVPWQLIQRYYAHPANQDRLGSLFEPHVQPEDLMWHPIESVLSHLEQSLAFWQGTAHLGMVVNGKPVSFNILDTLLSHCNQLPFEQRISHYLKTSLWHELMFRYFNHDKIEAALLTQLQPAVATSPYNEFA
jgi:hypothetical protein